ncbi:nitrous oxide-stimulated promoter family protein [Vibrio maerlii]|uniref:nitrous oxide-stimulated promoter family protein n=1 Tax=Vibrio maerlii TaxID=2231648 RepID=UPI000E3E08A5|nr:nitrous oxide-stimulated promoter family protein [Vibrio maerlii]
MSKVFSDILTGELLTEFKTVHHMTVLYCKKHHPQAEKEEGLCTTCRTLLDYAEMRLDRCPYGQGKPTCNKCPIHCYKPEEKEQMRQVMRFGGPRMLIHHPLLAIRHLRHEKRPVPDKPALNASNRAMRKKRR